MTTKTLIVALLLTTGVPSVANAKDTGPGNVTSVNWCWVTSPMTLIRPCKKT
jgi:hypothetical protein